MKIEQQLLDHYINRHTHDVLSEIEEIPIEEIPAILESISTESAALLLCQMDRMKAAQCLEKINLTLAAKIIEQLPESNSEILLRLVSENFFYTLLKGLPKIEEQKLSRIVKYPISAVGAHLNPVAFTVTADYSVKNTLEKIKKDKPQLHSHLYILDNNQGLTGYIELNKLITTERNLSIKAIVNSNPPKINASSSISSLADHENWIGTPLELPVVNDDGIFLGIVSKEILQQLTSGSISINKNVYKTGAALGELYKIGLASFLRITSEITIK